LFNVINVILRDSSPALYAREQLVIRFSTTITIKKHQTVFDYLEGGVRMTWRK